ncbi:SIMPL domain-containing protein [Ferviditalea candida]|uniref:SIMPL domain-containing protein n=1 Tax=Ferviditalea candida TaxID=3108399 RepID=A0ABU5ZF28_9BACL|nr:SIMPL domain-containing protein [Paenibacillaceae bacterium T2]
MKRKTGFLLTAMGIAAGLLVLPLIGGAGAVLLKSQSAFAAGSSSPAQQDQHLIVVSGQGEVSAEPDVAYISIGVETSADTANAAQSTNSKKFADLQSVLLNQYGIDKKEVQTTSFQVYPQYQYSDKQNPKVAGYTASHMVQVTYRNLPKLGQLLDDVSKSGVNRVNNIQFSTEKSQDYELQALQKAMDNAKAKAKALAQSAGKELGGVVNITQNGGSMPPVIYGNAKMVADSAASASTPVFGGEVTVSANVTVQFEFR